MRKIISSIWSHLVLSFLVLAVAAILQTQFPYIDLISKAGGVVALLASVLLFHRLLGTSFAESVESEYIDDGGVFDGDLEKVHKQAIKVVLRDYLGLGLLILGSLVAIFGDLLKQVILNCGVQ